jgi:hypothetical protein
MAKRNDLFPSKYLKAADLNGRAHVVQIDRAPTETFGKGNDQEQKTVLYFRDNDQKPLPLNMTNWDAVSSTTGEDDTVNWRGHYIEVYPDTTRMQGKLVDCVRIRVPQQKDLQLKPKPGPKPNGPGTDNNDLDDSIPF